MTIAIKLKHTPKIPEKLNLLVLLKIRTNNKSVSAHVLGREKHLSKYTEENRSERK